MNFNKKEESKNKEKKVEASNLPLGTGYEVTYLPTDVVKYDIKNTNINKKENKCENKPLDNKKYEFKNELDLKEDFDDIEEIDTHEIFKKMVLTDLENDEFESDDNLIENRKKAFEENQKKLEENINQNHNENTALYEKNNKKSNSDEYINVSKKDDEKDHEKISIYDTKTDSHEIFKDMVLTDLEKDFSEDESDNMLAQMKKKFEENKRTLQSDEFNE